MRMVPTTLEGQTVILEPLGPCHFEGLTAAALEAPEVWRYIPVRMQSEADVAAIVALARTHQEVQSGVVYVTRERQTGGVIGGTALMNVDAPNRRLEIGFTWLLPRFQRTRANTEAKYLQLCHCFETLGCARVEFKTDARNARSRAALARIGAVEEGTLRSHMACPDGSRRDSVYFSILDVEWPAVKTRLSAHACVASPKRGGCDSGRWPLNKMCLDQGVGHLTI